MHGSVAALSTICACVSGCTRCPVNVVRIHFSTSTLSFPALIRFRMSLASILSEKVILQIPELSLELLASDLLSDASLDSVASRIVGRASTGRIRSARVHGLSVERHPRLSGNSE